MAAIKWWNPERERVSIRTQGMQISPPVACAMDERGWKRVLVGFDPERRTVGIKEAQSGAGLKIGPSGSGKRITSKKMIRWLLEQGVSEGVYPATWEDGMIIVDIDG